MARDGMRPAPGQYTVIMNWNDKSEVDVVVYVKPGLKPQISTAACIEAAYEVGLPLEVCPGERAQFAIAVD
jgi:hypothetical protein